MTSNRINLISNPNSNIAYSTANNPTEFLNQVRTNKLNKLLNSEDDP
jgi:hypothetical protein